MGAAIALLVANRSPAADYGWRVGGGEVKVICPLTVGGSFEARTASLAGTLSLATPHPPAFAGELVVDLRTLDTGIDLRNQHLRTRYLEVERGSGFETAVLSQIGLADVDVETFQGRTVFTGTLLLHGAKQEVRGGAVIRHEGGGVSVEATFPVRLLDFGIASPQYLGVGVKNEVQVKVTLTGVKATPEGASR